eukprot:365744-Chlamydomonas_euryale.AAC.14
MVAVGWQEGPRPPLARPVDKPGLATARQVPLRPRSMWKASVGISVLRVGGLAWAAGEVLLPLGQTCPHCTSLGAHRRHLEQHWDTPAA